MYLNWLQSVIYGLVSGLTDILPVSAHAHRALLLKLFGVSSGMEWMNLMIHVGVAASLYISSQTTIVRISRARALARVPKRRRKRPLDEKSLMDFSFLRTMVIPVLLGLLVYRRAISIQTKLPLIAAALFFNGVMVYIPQFLPGSNRDSRTLSRLEGLLMGLGGALGVIPGCSAMGLSNAIGSMVGVERVYALNMTLLMNLFMNLGLAVHDVLLLIAAGSAGMSFGFFMRCLLTGIVAFAVSLLSIRLMRRHAQEHDNTMFGFYCMGLALFLFILNLMA